MLVIHWTCEEGRQAALHRLQAQFRGQEGLQYLLVLVGECRLDRVALGRVGLCGLCGLGALRRCLEKISVHLPKLDLLVKPSHLADQGVPQLVKLRVFIARELLLPRRRVIAQAVYRGVGLPWEVLARRRDRVHQFLRSQQLLAHVIQRDAGVIGEGVSEQLRRIGAVRGVVRRHLLEGVLEGD